jgi:hypothetical protein
MKKGRRSGMVRREKRRQVRCVLPRETPDVLRQAIQFFFELVESKFKNVTQVKGIWIKTK